MRSKRRAPCSMVVTPQVEWATNTRVQPDRDVIILPNLYSPTLDPSAPASRTSAKMAVDATMPLGEETVYSRLSVPGIERADLAGRLDRIGWKRPSGTAPPRDSTDSAGICGAALCSSRFTASGSISLSPTRRS